MADLEAETFLSVLNGEEWVFYVAHLSGGKWQFFSKDKVFSREGIVVVSRDQLLQLDLRLQEIEDLPAGWHTWRDDPESEWRRAKRPEGPTFFFRFRLAEKQSLEVSTADLWIIASDLSEARQRGLQIFKNMGIVVTDEIEAHEVQAIDYEEDEKGLDFYRKVQFDGYLFLAGKKTSSGSKEAISH